MSNVSISTNKLSIGYGATIVQRDLTFSLYEGEMVCMLGPNGCGKSTLLRTLAGLQPALGGEIKPNPDPSLKGREAAKQMALVLTERLSLENTTVHDVVAMGRFPYTSFLGGLTERDEQIIAASLQAVGFNSLPFTGEGLCPIGLPVAVRRTTSGVGSSFFNAHSDGEKQRILIAKALAQETPIILLDEPTAHLDLPHRILVLRLLRTLAHEQGKTILISTHELDLALALSDRILLMTPGQGIQLDTAQNLRERDAFTIAFGMDIFHPLG